MQVWKSCPETLLWLRCDVHNGSSGVRSSWCAGRQSGSRLTAAFNVRPPTQPWAVHPSRPSLNSTTIWRPRIYLRWPRVILGGESLVERAAERPKLDRPSIPQKQKIGAQQAVNNVASQRIQPATNLSQIGPRKRALNTEDNNSSRNAAKHSRLFDMMHKPWCGETRGNRVEGLESGVITSLSVELLDKDWAFACIICCLEVCKFLLSVLSILCSL